MDCRMIAVVVLSLVSFAVAQTTQPADRVDELLTAGDLKAAEAQLEKMLKADAKDDHARFGLGTVQVLRAVENLFQTLHSYGFPKPSIGGPLLPAMLFTPNAEPKTVAAEDVRRMLVAWTEQLARAEKTLSEIRNTDVKMPLHFGLIRLDLNGDGKAEEREALWRVYGAVSGDRIEQSDAAGFLIVFDAADVEWLRGYCDLLMAMTEFALAHDGGELFDRTAQLFFPKVKTPYPFLCEGQRVFDFYGIDIVDAVAFVHLLNLPVAEPARLKASLEHLQAMTSQSRKMWKLAMAETDDDHEWIPNPKQHCVIPEVRVTLEMVDQWQAFLDEADAILAGKKLVPFWRGAGDLGVNVRRVFLEPKRFDLVLWVQGSAAAPYLEKGPLTKRETWDRLMRVFEGNFIGFAFWFN